MMQKLILDWRHKYDGNHVRECFHYWICKHQHEKILALVNKRKHRKLKVAILKQKLEEYRYEEEQEKFLELLDETQKVQ